MSIAGLYTNFRSSRTFLWALCGVCFGWLAWNLCPWVPHFDDPAFGRLTLLLSVEASITTSLVLIATETLAAISRKQLSYMQHLLEAQIELLDRVHATLAILVARRGEADPGTGGSHAG